jgi:hypothetical protein
VGLERSRERARRLAGEAREEIHDLDAGELLAALADRAVERTH